MKRTLIRQVHLLDPAQGLDGPGSVLIEGTRLHSVALEDMDPAEADVVVDGEGKYLLPGLVDLHAHLREPGGEVKETLDSGAKAALHGGFTTVVAMPNTDPPVDRPELLRALRARVRMLKGPDILFAACISQGRSGKALSEILLLRDAGAVAFTDDGDWVRDGHLFYQVMTYSAAFGFPVLSHAQDPSLYREGVAHEGPRSRKLGLPGIPRSSETVAVFRDLEIARETGGHLHIQHVSAAETLSLIQDARAQGVRVTAEVTPHHLLWTDEVLETFDPVYKVNPPLREERDRETLRQALREGHLEAVATDHAPHTTFEKTTDWLVAPFGILGLETALSSLWTYLVKPGLLSFSRLVEALTSAPARILGLKDRGTLRPGYRADLVLFDPEAQWEVLPENLYSRSRNTPLLGTTLSGVIHRVWVAGEEVFPFP